MSKTKAQLLEEAQIALHQLRTGRKVVSFNDGTTTVQYNAASIKSLQNYVDSLDTQVNKKSRRRAPASVSF